VRVIAVAVAAGDTSITIVDTQFGRLVTADFPPPTNCILLRVVMAAGSATAAAFYIPTTVGVGNHMMCFRSLSHATSFVNGNPLFRKSAD
jgi:hypothetical protein